MAMLPFLGYDVGDYFSHWIDMGKAADAFHLPRIFYVNWFRRDGDGAFLWPGFGDNVRVLKWALERIDGTVAAADTAIGRVPAIDAIDVSGLDLSPEQLEAVLAVEPDEWHREIGDIEEWFAKVADTLPSSLRDELESLKLRLGY
jgi:phosphoenolpyruvate carboxykinase (GTP)